MATILLASLPQPRLRAQPEQPAAARGTTLRWATELGEAVQTVAWLPDHSAVLALTAAGRVMRLCAADGQPAWGATAPSEGALCLSLCPTAPVVATGHLDGTLRLRNATTGKTVSVQCLSPVWVERVSWSPDGQRLAAVCGRTLHLLNGLGQVLASYHGHQAAIETVCWRADSGALATTSAATVRLFSAGAGPAALLPYQIMSSGQPVLALAWSSTGRQLVAGLPAGRLHSWQLPGVIGAGRPLLGRAGPVRALSWHANGQRLAAAHGPDVSVWEAASDGLQRHPTRLTHHTHSVQHTAFQHRGNLLATADAGGTLAFWAPFLQVPSIGEQRLGSGITALQWMHNDCCLAVGTTQGRVAVLSIIN